MIVPSFVLHAGGSIGNKTDAFISLVYGDIMVQTEVRIDPCGCMHDFLLFQIDFRSLSFTGD